MSRSVLSARALAIYLFIVGTILVVAPNALLLLSRMAPTGEVWIRVIGVLAFNIGVFAWMAARHADRHFMVASVYTRILFFVATATFAALGLVHHTIILFGMVDLAGGLWTYLALQADARFDEAQARA